MNCTFSSSTVFVPEYFCENSEFPVHQLGRVFVALTRQFLLNIPIGLDYRRSIPSAFFSKMVNFKPKFFENYFSKK